MTYSCYVKGCHEDSTVGRIHKAFGRVDCCPGHDPARFGQDSVFYAQVEEPVETPISDDPPLSKEQLIAAMLAELIRMSRSDDGPSSGKKARLQKPKPILPSSGVALCSRVA